MATKPTAVERFREQMIAIITEAERDLAAERSAAGETGPEDSLSRSYLRWIAKELERTKRGADAERHALLVDSIGDTFTLRDIRVLRTAAEAAAAATPALIMKKVSEGMEVPLIADEIGLTQSRVYGIIREQRNAQ